MLSSRWHRLSKFYQPTWWWKRSSASSSLRSINPFSLVLSVSSFICHWKNQKPTWLGCLDITSIERYWLAYLSWMGCFGHWTMKGSHAMGTAFAPQRLNSPNHQRPGHHFLLRCWLPLLYKPMGKNLRQRLRRSGRGMVTKKVLSDGTISVWGTQIEIYISWLLSWIYTLAISQVQVWWA